MADTELGALLRRHRLARGMTQESLAERAGVSARGISDLERGIHARARRSTLDRLASALDLNDEERARLLATSFDLAASAAPPLPPVLSTHVGDAFVGRDAPTAELEAIFREVEQGATRVAVIAGDPGIGKSTLARVVSRRWHAAGATILWGDADEDSSDPYRPVREAIRHLAASPGFDLGHWSLVDRAAIGAVVPELGRPADVGHVDQLAVHESLRRLLTEHSRTRPVVLVIDDLQSADAATLGLLRSLSRNEVGRIMVLTTARLDGPGRSIANWIVDLRRSGVRTPVLALEGLAEAEVAELLREAAGYAPLGLSAAIVAETAGNPFFVVEVIAELTRSDAVRDGRWRTRLAAGVPRGSYATFMVEHWVAQLPASARELLSCAAVLGTTFRQTTLQTVSASDDRTVADTLDAAVALGLLIEEPTPLDTWRFVHGIVRSWLYESIGPNERVRIHARTADVLAAEYDGTNEAVERLAFHYSHALRIPGTAEPAMRYSIESARRAAAALAWDDAAVQLERALEAERLVPVSDGDQRVELLLELGRAHTEALQRHRARPVFLEAARLATDLGGPDLICDAAVGYSFMTKQGDAGIDATATWRRALATIPDDRPAQHAMVEAAISTAARLEDDGATMRASAESSLRSARRSSDDRALQVALVVHSSALWDSPSLDLRIALAAELRDLARAADDTEVELDALALAVLPLAAAGRAQEVDDIIASVNDIGTRHQRRISIAQSRQWMAMRALMQGDEVSARRHAESALELSGAAPNFAIGHAAFSYACSRLLHPGRPVDPVLDQVAQSSDRMTVWGAAAAAAHCAAGNPHRARHLLTQFGPDWSAGLPPDWTWLTTVALLAEVAAHVGTPDEAASLGELLKPFQGQLVIVASGTSCEGAVDRYSALVANAIGDRDAARTFFHQAIELERAADAPALAARTEHELTELLA